MAYPLSRRSIRSRALIALLALGSCVLTACSEATGDGPTGPEPPIPPEPTITAVTPGEGPVDGRITIEGRDFGDAQDGGGVSLGGGLATVSSWSATRIEALVPDLFPGTYELTVSVGGVVSNAVTFQVILPPAVYIHNDADSVPSSVSGWSIDESGALTPLPGSPYMTGGIGAGFSGDAYHLQIHEPTRRLFASAHDAAIVFDIDPVTGALTPVPGSPFSAGTGLPTFGLAVTRPGDRVYLANFAQGASTSFISIFDVALDGSLTHHPGSPFDTGVGSRADIALLTPDDRFLYVNTEDGEFLGYSVAQDGSLTQLSGSPYLIDPMSRASTARLSPDGTKLFIPETAIVDALMVYDLDPSTGIPELVTGSPFDAGNNPNGMAFTPDGNRLYVANYKSDQLYAFEVADDGVLTPMATSSFRLTSIADGLSSIEISADGEYLVAVDEGINTDMALVAVYRLDPDGTPIEMPGSPYPSDVPEGRPSGLALTF